MTKKKKSKALPLIILILILALLGALYYILDGMKLNEKNDTPDVTPSIKVIDRNAVDITEITYSDANGNELSFTRENGVWSDKADLDFPVKQSKLDAMANAVASVTASRELSEDSGDYGFDKPSLSVSVIFSDGEEHSLVIGKTNTFNNSVYLKDHAKVFMFGDSISTQFTTDKNELIQLDDPAADVDANYLVSVDVLDSSGMSNSITDSSGEDELMRLNDEGLDCTDWVEYGMGSADFEKYGIKPDGAKLMINYKSAVLVTDSSGESSTTRIPKTYEVFFGNETEREEDGQTVPCVYYTITDSSILYRTDKETYDKIMGYVSYAPETQGDTSDSAESSEE